ncbi:MAG: methyltransferase domain-containing protein [Pseudomonadota bacterium]
MIDPTSKDWDPGSYHRFRGLRLQPALDLLARVGPLPDGPVVDLGCGTGAVAEVLRARFPERRLVGVDHSEVMLEEAEKTGLYDALVRADVAEWSPASAPALLFSNAVLHWLPEHPVLFSRLVETLAPGGVLAVQMPRQLHRPSHHLIYQTAAELFPDRFSGQPAAQVAPPAEAWPWLSALGELEMWETEFIQPLPAHAEAHPVRSFTQSTACRPVLAKLDTAETERFFAAYDAALSEAYPLQPDGGAVFPFLRQFIILRR